MFPSGRSLSVVVLALVLVSRLLAGPDDDFVAAYQLLQQTAAERERGAPPRAREGYLKAQEMLRALQRSYPQWNDRVVAYRLRYVAEKLEALPAADAAGTSTAAPSDPAPAPANEVITQFNTLNQEISLLRGEKQRLEARLREALTAQPAPVDPQELKRAVDRIAQLQSTNQALITRLETQERERSGLVDKVLLVEAQQALAAAKKDSVAQRDKTAELERQRNQADAELKRLREGEVKALKTENTALKGQVDALKSDTERGQQIASLAKRLEVLQARYDEASKANQTLQVDHDRLERQLQDLKARQSEEGILKVKQLETALVLAKAEADRHAAAAAKLESQLSAEVVKRTQAEGENQELTRRVAALTEQVSGIQKLQTQLEAEREERGELERQLKAAEARLAAAQQAAAATPPPPPASPKAAASVPAPVAPSVPDPALIAQIQELSVETSRLRDALKESRSRQVELASLVSDAKAAVGRLEAEKKAMLKTLDSLKSTPAERQLSRSERTVRSLQERVQDLERDKAQLMKRLETASDRSRNAIQLVRRHRLGIPKEDAQMFRDLRMQAR
ncbi:MAG: hypothetical protein ACO3I0_01365 [Limisphaerales bacterium]